MRRLVARTPLLGSLGFAVLAFCAGKEPEILVRSSRPLSTQTPNRAAAAAARSFYVSPGGSASGEGTAESPWDLQTALDQPPSVRPGDTVWLRGGTYGGSFTSRLNGLPESPIRLRQYPGERATLDGGTSDGATAIMTVMGSYTWFWGFEVTSSDQRRQSSQNGSSPSDIFRGDGFAIAQEGGGVTHPGIRFINLVVHDTRQGFSFWEEAVDGEISGCLIYFNGHTAPDRGHGHGIYTQNQSGTKTISGNILFSGFGLGIQAFGSSSVFLDNLVAQGNTIFNSGDLEPSGGSRNFLIGGGTTAKNPEIRENALYRLPGELQTDFKLGYTAGCDHPVIVDNYIAGSVDIDCTNMTVSGNTFYGSPITGIGPIQFPDSSYLSARPSGVRVFVVPNAYEGGRGHVTVYNWARQPKVDVDLSSILSPGSTFEIRNAQDFFGAPVLSGTYAGGVVSLPMTNLSVATPVGWAPPSPTGSEFNVFVVLTTQFGREVPLPASPRPPARPTVNRPPASP